MKRVLWLFFTAAFIISVIADFLFLHGEGAALLGLSFPGMFSVFGLAACVGIIILSKWLGHYWLQKKEDYYRKKDDHD